MTDRKIDLLVASHVMGHRVVGSGVYMELLPDGGSRELAHYSTDIAAAWEVVNVMHAQGIYAGIQKDTGPLAVALAALAAKGVDVEQ